MEKRTETIYGYKKNPALTEYKDIYRTIHGIRIIQVGRLKYMWNLLVKPISDTINNIIDKVAPDVGMAEQLKFEITKELINSDNAALKNQANVIMSEANGDSWLQRNWRPMVMINFAMLITAHWLGYTPINLPETQVVALLEIVKVGLGGYVIGRSAEKVMKEYKR